MSNNKKHLHKWSSVVNNMMGELANNLSLNKLPSKEELSNTKQNKNNRPFSYRIKDSGTLYTYQNGKANKAGGNIMNAQLNFSTNTNNHVNQNTNTPNEDFPGSFNLPVPNPSTLKFLGTGNGNGGEMFDRDQVKIAEEQMQPQEGRNVFSAPFGQTISRRFAMSGRDFWDMTPGLARTTRAINPLAYIGKGSEYSPQTGALVGALSLALTGLGASGIYHYFTKNRRINPETGKGPSLLKDMLLGTALGAVGGGVLGHALGTDIQNANLKNQKTASTMFGSPMSSFSDVALINNKIMGDSSLSFDQRRQLMNLINQLPSTSISQLAPMVGSLIGTGAGAIIAKYLLNMGITGTVLTSILGAVMGSGIVNRFAPTNPTFKPIQGMGFLDNLGRRI